MTGHVFFSWADVTILFIAVLAMVAIKMYEGKLFYTVHVFVRKFNMLDLQFPSSAVELSFYIRGIYCFPKEISKRISGALKHYLWLNYLFYPLFCIFIFAICMKTSEKFSGAGKPFFITLAWLQVFTLIIALITNSQLLSKIHPDYKPHRTLRIYTVLLYLKYGFSLFALISVIAVFYYFWLSGGYQLNNIWYAVAMALFAIIFLVLLFLISKIKRINLDLLKNLAN